MHLPMLQVVSKRTYLEESVGKEIYFMMADQFNVCIRIYNALLPASSLNGISDVESRSTVNFKTVFNESDGPN